MTYDMSKLMKSLKSLLICSAASKQSETRSRTQSSAPTFKAKPSLWRSQGEQPISAILILTVHSKLQGLDLQPIHISCMALCESSLLSHQEIKLTDVGIANHETYGDSNHQKVIEHV